MKSLLYWIDITVFLIFFGIALWHWQRSSHYLIGIVLAGSGFCLWILARHQLGRSFAVTAEAKKLVTHGLYSRFRNPVYAILGLFIAWGRLAPTIVYLAAYIPMQIARAKKEAQVLEATFGDEYRRYRAQTWL